MDKAHVLTDIKLDDMEKELEAIYQRASKEIQAKGDAFFKKLAEEDAKKRQLVKSGKMTEKQYQAWLKQKLATGKWYKEMRKQLAVETSHVNQTALAYINGELPYVYSINYNAVDNQLGKVKGYSFRLVSPETVKVLAGNDKSLLPMKVLDVSKDVAWNMKAINAEVLQGIIQGESVDSISKRVFGFTSKKGGDIGDLLKKNQVVALRTARTIVTAAENKGRQDSYDRLTKDGVIIKKRWLATLDKRVRDSHLALHDTMVDENKPFDNGLMFPADPNGRPEEVYNCRCSMAAVVVGFRRV